jgi:phage baseplate assembly protein V
MQRRIRLMVGRAIIRLVNDAARVQEAQVTLLEDETRDGVERFQEYGFTSVPLPGAEAIMVSVSGNRDHGVIIAVEDRRYRLTGIEGGEVALYTDEGDKIHLKRGNAIDIDTDTLTINATTKVQVNTPLLQVTGGDVKADTISLKTHKHGGVTTGSGQTGVPV